MTPVFISFFWRFVKSCRPRTPFWPWRLQQRSTHIFLHWWYEDKWLKSWLLLLAQNFFPLMPLESATLPGATLRLTPPPHNGVGKEEDSLISTQMINVKVWKGCMSCAEVGICRIPPPCTINMESENEGLEDDFPFQRGDLQNSC